MVADPTKKLRIAMIYSYGANEPETDGLLGRKTRKIPQSLTKAAAIFLTRLFWITMRCSKRAIQRTETNSKTITKMFLSV